MNEPAVEQPKPKDPIRDLVAALTPDTSKKLKGFLLPPQTGIYFVIGKLVYRVSKINAGQLRFSAEFYGLRVPNGIMRPGGNIETQAPTGAVNEQTEAK